LNYLVDTDWIINYLKGHNKTVNVLGALHGDGLAISVVSFSEIYEGIYYFENPKRKKLEGDFKNFLEGVMVLDVDEDIGKKFGQLRAKLRKKGNLIDNFDLLIASTAICYNLVLLSENVRHFNRVEGLQLKNTDKFEKITRTTDSFYFND
jgi:tRNA(fMet)-specific endonuclease VapC